MRTDPLNEETRRALISRAEHFEARYRDLFEALRAMKERWHLVADRHHPPGEPVEPARDHHPPELGTIVNQTAAACWRGCADELRAILDAGK